MAVCGEDMVTLSSSDDELIQVPYDTIKLSNVICESLKIHDMKSDIPIPVPSVNATILKKVLEWCEYHKNDPRMVSVQDPTNAQWDLEHFTSWDTEYLKVDQGTLFAIISAAHYLKIPGLLDVTCRLVANMMKGKTAEQIRQTFNIKNDFTPEEEAEIKERHAKELAKWNKKQKKKNAKKAKKRQE